MKYFLKVIICLFVVSPCSGQDIEKEYHYSKNIYDPSEFFVLSEDTVLTVELSNKEAILSLHDLKNEQVIATRRAGNGPGELSENGVKYITWFKNDSLWVWDSGQRKGIIFDANLEYVGDIRVKDSAIGSSLILNDTTAVTKKAYGRETVAELRRLEGYEITDEIYERLETKKVESLKQINENPLLNQGTIYSHKGATYLGFDYGSTIMKIAPDENLDSLSVQNYIPLPEVDYQNGYSAPDHSKSPKGTLDITADSEYIYVLFSGKKFDSNPFRQLKGAITGKLADQLEESDNAKTIQMYDRVTNEYKGDLKLPVISKKINIYKDKLYSLSYEDSKYKIIKYQLGK